MEAGVSHCQHTHSQPATYTWFGSREDSHLHSWASAVVARVVRSHLVAPLSRRLNELAVGALVVPSRGVLCGG